MRIITLLLAGLLLSSSAFALVDSKFNELEGYTIIATPTIVGWYDESGHKGDAFEGCDYGRTIVFDNNKILTCRSYRYHYAYRPKATLLSNGGSYKMIVGEDVYNMGL